MDIFCLDTSEFKSIKSDLTPYLSALRHSKVQSIVDCDCKVQSIGVELALCVAVRHIDSGATIPVSYYYDKCGKPVLSDYPNFNISFSHTSGMSVVAIGGSFVGVDIEKRKEINPKFADRMLNGAELKEYQLLNEDKKRRFILDSFVKKESFVKATGEGLTKFPCKISLPKEAKTHIFDIVDDKFVVAVTTLKEESVNIHLLSVARVLKVLE
ncbi:MAG: 4'-phosphopantetheinyl transferase superfamily protein [Bacillota bacterium]